MNTKQRTAIFLIVGLLILGCAAQQFVGLALTPTPTFSPTYVALNVNEYPGFTVYWKQTLWESAVRGTIVTEDFEKDEADYGEIAFPYLTGNGFFLTGQSTAQILNDETLLNTGNLIHFRGWENGLIFTFPNDTAVEAFGFDYKPSETWQLTVNGSVITIPDGRRGFIGIVVHEEYPKQFVFSCAEDVQGGLSVDNISYVPINSP
jgi:hypothetical protein